MTMSMIDGVDQSMVLAASCSHVAAVGQASVHRGCLAIAHLLQGELGLLGRGLNRDPPCAGSPSAGAGLGGGICFGPGPGRPSATRESMKLTTGCTISASARDLELSVVSWWAAVRW